MAEILQQVGNVDDPKPYKDMRTFFKGCINMLDIKSNDENQPFGSYSEFFGKVKINMPLMLENWTVPTNEPDNFQEKLINPFAMKYPKPMLFKAETKEKIGRFDKGRLVSPPPCDEFNKAFLNLSETDSIFQDISQLFFNPIITAQKSAKKKTKIGEFDMGK